MPQARSRRGRHNAEVGIIVWPGAYAMSTPFQAGLADQLGKRVMDRPDSEPHAEPGEEERGRARLRPAAVTHLGVSAQRLDHAVVQRHLALLSPCLPQTRGAPSWRSTWLRSSASASPSLTPVTASSPINVSNVAARDGGLSAHAPGSSAQRSRSASRYTAPAAVESRATNPLTGFP